MMRIVCVGARVQLFLLPWGAGLRLGSLGALVFAPRASVPCCVEVVAWVLAFPVSLSLAPFCVGSALVCCGIAYVVVSNLLRMTLATILFLRPALCGCGWLVFWFGPGETLSMFC